MPVYRKKDENFFRKWTSEMAYVLGFFVADGYMIKNKRGACFVDFTSTDRIILEKIRKVLGSNLKISVRKRREDWKPIYRIQIGSKKIHSDLSDLGITQNKSKTVVMPKVPNNLFSHFVRGYFDGDGHVYVGCYPRKDSKNRTQKTVIITGFTSASRKFLEALHQKLLTHKHVVGGTLYSSSRSFRLCFSAKDSKRLYNLMYGKLKDNLYLSRKKVVFEKYFKMM